MRRKLLQGLASTGSWEFFLLSFGDSTPNPILIIKAPSEAQLLAEVLEQGVWALGNIAGLAASGRDFCECCGACVPKQFGVSLVTCALRVFCFSSRVDFRRLRDR